MKEAWSMQILLLVGYVFVVLYIGISEGHVCEQKTLDCDGDNCITTVPCMHGECDMRGVCQCHSCYSGFGCITYVDDYGPEFTVKDNTIAITPAQQGAIYIASAKDGDLELCSDTIAECPCARMYYSIFGDASIMDMLNIDQQSGVINLMPGIVLQAGKTHDVEIIASNSKETTGDNLELDVMTLSIMVEEGNEEEEEEKKENVEGSDEHGNIEQLYKQTWDTNKLEAKESHHIRHKRSAFGTAREHTNMTLIALNDPAIGVAVSYGNTLKYRIELILPNITTNAMDLTVEIFVMDVVSGVTPFGLCQVAVPTIGTLIKDVANQVIVPTITMVKNAYNDQLYDRATISFGNVTNSDTFLDGSTTFGDSTIEITFEATLYKTSLYDNLTAIITTGAEYDLGNFVWVGQAEYQYDFNPVNSFSAAITMSGEDVLPQFSGGTYIINAQLTEPKNKMTLDISSPFNTADKFSITNVFLKSEGINYGCITANNPVKTFYKTTTGRSNHRAVLTYDYALKEVDNANIAGELLEAGNSMVLGFTILIIDGVLGETIGLAAGITIGTTSIWTGALNITVLAAVAPSTTAPTGYTLVDIGPTPASVSLNGVHTFGIKAPLPANGGALIGCAVTTVPSLHKICGVLIGDSGANLVTYPDMSDLVTYSDDGTAAWGLTANTTYAGGFVDTTQDYIMMEVSVFYGVMPPSDVTVTCDTELLTLSASEIPQGTIDMDGTSAAVPATNTWIYGSQAAIVMTLKFTGTPYGNAVLETSGDFLITSWGAHVCSVDVLSAGIGVPCIASIKDNFTNMVTLRTTASTFLDGAVVDLGPACGIDRGAGQMDGDRDVQVRIAYEIAKPQAVLAEPYNISAGVLVDEVLILAAYETFAVSLGPPVYDSTKPPLFTVSYPDFSTIPPGVPYVIEVMIKTYPGTVETYTLTASVTSAAVTTIAICKMNILNVGSSYPCLKTNPYENTDPNADVTVTHDPVLYGKQVILTLGAVANLGIGEYYHESVLDENSIHIGLVIKGVVDGADSVTLVLDTSGITQTQVIPTIVSGVATPSGTLLNHVSVVGQDGTLDIYEEEMKLMDIILDVPLDYVNPVLIEIINNDPTTINLCFAGVATAGMNVPCVIQSDTNSTSEITDTVETLTIDVKDVCYYFVSDNAEDNKIRVMFGVMLVKGSTTGSFDVVVHESLTPLAPITTTLTKAAAAYVPTTYDMTSANITLLDPIDTIVTPGQRLYVGAIVSIPRDTTSKFVAAAMTTSDTGRAYATVHNWRFPVSDSSKNLGCFRDVTVYDMELVQNSSMVVPMIHPSQTDTMVVDLGYLTNHGLTYYQKVNQQIDDEFQFEAEILIADHPNATDGDILYVNFAIKMGNVILVITKPLILSKLGTEVYSIVTDFFLTDNTTTYFDTGEQIGCTVRFNHDNVSAQELNNVIVRILLPEFFVFFDPSDTWNSNITANLTNKGYLDFVLDYLFFTDILEFNFTVTMNPFNNMTKGLGEVNATLIMRLVASPADPTAILKYIGTSKHIVVAVNGEDCFDALSMSGFSDCQFSASTAMDAATAPQNVISLTGWSPAVRSGSFWMDYITIDFLGRKRFTKAVFTPVTSMKTVSAYKVQFSHSGVMFIDACSDTILVSAVNLPIQCRIEARFIRLVIVTTAGSEEQLGVNLALYGCPVESSTSTCVNTTATTTIYSDVLRGWRHVAYDPLHLIIYFCDYSPKKKRTVCYDSADDSGVWNAIPSYIGRIVGYDATTQMMFAMDVKEKTMVMTQDGKIWKLVNTADIAAIQSRIVPAQVIPGKGQTALGDVAIDGSSSWIADFTGLKVGTVYKVKWESCCT